MTIDGSVSADIEFRLIADSAPVPMWVTRPDRERLFVNKAYVAFLGMPYDEAVAFDWRHILHPDDAERIVAESVAGEASLSAFSLEARYRRHDGEWRWIQSVSQPRWDAQGRHVGFIGVAHDVTETKRAELELREREAQLSAYINQATAGFGQVDLEGRFTLVNDRFCEIAGRTREELLTLRMQDITHPEDLPKNVVMFDAAVHQGLPYAHEKRYLRPDGNTIWVNNSVAVIRRADGSPYGILAISVDVTARHEAQEALERSEALVRENAARLAFLDMLGEATASACDADEVLAITTRLLGEHLGASACTYADVEPDQTGMNVRGGWSAGGTVRTVGAYGLEALGSKAVNTLSAGLPLVVENTVRDLGDDGGPAFLAIGSRASITVPLVKQGLLISAMAVHSDEPRAWTAAEVALIAEVTGRSWAHIERARSAVALRESEHRLRLAVEGARIGTWDWDLVEGTGTWSGRTSEIFGVQPKQLVSSELRYSLVHPDDREEVRREVAQVIASGSEYAREYRVIRPDGGLRWVASRGVVQRDEQGRAIRMTGTLRDVTSRRLAQEQLAALNRTLEREVTERTTERDRMWRLSRDLLVIVGRAHDIRAVNPALASLGYTAADVMGRKIEQFIHPDDLPAMGRAITLAMRGGGAAVPGDLRTRVRAADGSWRDYSWTAAPGDGAAYVIGRDVTIETERRRELELAQEALRQSQKVEALGQLTGGVAHDFNNLLTPIIGSLDLLQRNAASDRDLRLIGAAIDAADRARVLVQRLLAFARRQPLQPGPVDLGAVVRGMSELIASTAGPTIAVTIDVPAHLPAVRGDFNQLEMAILNLCVNARDAMPDGGTLAIAAAREQAGGDDLVRLTIADSGVGMDEATLARAIEPFFSTKGLGRGTGLGLSMVHGLASQLGGRLDIVSSPREGTTVSLLLPVENDLPVVIVEAAHGRDRSSLGKVLLVDDDDAVRGTTAAMLADLGFDVAEANCGKQALDMLRSGGFDYLVTDHLMPGMAGTELARLARDLDPELRILIVSGYAELEGIPADLRRLAKPFRLEELSLAIAALPG